MASPPPTPDRTTDEHYEMLRELKRALNTVLEETTNALSASSSTSSEAKTPSLAQAGLTLQDRAVCDLVAWTERVLWHGLRRQAILRRDATEETPITLIVVVL